MNTPTTPTAKSPQAALVVLSGGQDSVTCLGLALAGHYVVHAITFDYGQRHRVELDCAESLCKRYNVPQKVIDVAFLARTVTSAITSGGDTSKPHPYKPGLPASFVPGRNALFLVLAHAYAQEIGANVIYTGVCQTDYSGYPDCRSSFVVRLADALNVGYETAIAIKTPLMELTKAATFRLAEEVGFLNEVRFHSHTCYEGNHTTVNDWGYGCGQCPACKLRAKGWAEYMADKTKVDAPPTPQTPTL